MFNDEPWEPRNYDDYDGEISRQLNDTQINARSEDRETAVDDYPILPVRRRFWEHVIRDEDDYARHVDYIHYNPVKHEHCARAADWQ